MMKFVSKAVELIAEKTASMQSTSYLYAPKVPAQLKARLEKKEQSK